MGQHAITITQTECEPIKKLKKADTEFILQLTESLEDAKHGRIRRVA